MEININRLEERITNINNLIDEYEILHLNLYNQQRTIDNSWTDKTSKMFINKISEEQLKDRKFIDELNEIEKIYQFIIDSYKDLGTKIYYQENSSEKIIKSINKNIDQEEKIIDMYKRLDLSFLENEKEIINNEISIIENIQKREIEIKNSYTKVIEKIEEIEKKLLNKISKVKVEIITESDIKELL